MNSLKTIVGCTLLTAFVLIAVGCGGGGHHDRVVREKEVIVEPRHR